MHSKFIPFALLMSLAIQAFSPEDVIAAEATASTGTSAVITEITASEEAPNAVLQLNELTAAIMSASASDEITFSDSVATIENGISTATAETIATFLPSAAAPADESASDETANDTVVSYSLLSAPASEGNVTAVPGEDVTLQTEGGALTENSESADVAENSADEIIPASLTISRVVSVPEYSGFKSFEDYSRFKSTSNQKRLQDLATTDENGLRVVDGRYTIAVGSATGASVGQYIDLVLENGTVIECVMGDLKADKDTDAQNLITNYSNCCSEFIVETRALSKEIRYYGNLSKLSDAWNSRVVQIIIYDAYVDGFAPT